MVATLTDLQNYRLLIQQSHQPEVSTRAANKLFDQVEVLYRKLRTSRDGRRGIEMLLADDDPVVRLRAARHTLAWDQDRGAEVLREVANGHFGMVSHSAKYTYQNFLAGQYPLETDATAPASTTVAPSLRTNTALREEDADGLFEFHSQLMNGGLEHCLEILPSITVQKALSAMNEIGLRELAVSLKAFVQGREGSSGMESREKSALRFEEDYELAIPSDAALQALLQT
jgi:hypothetical protein